MRNTFIRLLIILFVNTFLYAGDDYLCDSKSNLEKLKHKSFEALEVIFNENDLRIFARIFQTYDVSVIEIDHKEKRSVCEIKYKIIPLPKAIALQYLMSIGNGFSEFKGILTALAYLTGDDRKEFEQKLKKLSIFIPKTRYEVKKINNKVYLDIQSFSLFKLFKEHKDIF